LTYGYIVIEFYGESMEKTLKTGTTTVGLICKDAVIIAADQKATMGYMVDSKVAQKIHQLEDHIGMTIAGSVGDAYSLIRLLKAQFKLYKLERGPISVKAAATLLANILHGSKWFPYMNQLIIAGFDDKGPQIYSLDPLGGWDMKDKYYSTGSGSPFAYGYLESGFKENSEEEEAVKIAINAVKVARERDIASGGKSIDVAVIDKNGFRELNESQIKKLI
jgi:proteasome beta subunit